MSIINSILNKRQRLGLRIWKKYALFSIRLRLGSKGGRSRNKGNKSKNRRRNRVTITQIL